MANEIDNLPAVKNAQSWQKWFKSDAIVARIAESNVMKTHNAKTIAGMVALSVSKDKYLSECDPWSILQATMSCVSLGLLPDGVSGQAYLVPFKGVCTLIIGYRGMIQLGYRSGMVKDWGMPQIVWEGDDFTHHLGDRECIIHNPCGKRAKRVGVYNIVELTTGGKVRVSLTADEVMAVKKKSRGSDRSASPWQNDESAMWMKTAVRRVAKFVPSCTELQRAITIDEESERVVVEQVATTPSQIERELSGEVDLVEQPLHTEDDPPREEDFIDAE